MADGVRERMIAGAVRLLAERGLDGTTFSEVLELTGTPRGSIYHHFPDGKDQLIAAAIVAAGERAIGVIDLWHGASPAEVTENFLELWRRLLLGAGFRAGCSVLAVTVATDSSALLDGTAAVFRSWRVALADLLREGGAGDREADRFAAILVASSEGAVVMSRAERTIEPFELVADHLIAHAEGLTAVQRNGGPAATLP
jgi:TetR/AcrR family transcriptional regulator, lmrAB and yxaGH operons repressor